MNTRRMNRLEELGRVDAEKAFTKKGARNLREEKKRIVGELKKAKGGKVLKKVKPSQKGLKKLPTKVRNKMGYMKKGGSTRNTRRMNRLEELGRVDSERGKTRRGKQNLRQERKRLVRELKKR